MSLILLVLAIFVFYVVVFILSDFYLLPKIDRYLDARKKRRSK